MNRITEKDLESRVKYLNKITNSPETYATKKPEGGLDIHPGHYHLDGAYGGWKLVRTCNTGGGISDISRQGYTSKRELYTWINAYIDGIQEIL